RAGDPVRPADPAAGAGVRDRGESLPRPAAAPQRGLPAGREDRDHDVRRGDGTAPAVRPGYPQAHPGRRPGERRQTGRVRHPADRPGPGGRRPRPDTATLVGEATVNPNPTPLPAPASDEPTLLEAILARTPEPRPVPSAGLPLVGECLDDRHPTLLGRYLIR